MRENCNSISPHANGLRSPESPASLLSRVGATRGTRVLRRSRGDRPTERNP